MKNEYRHFLKKQYKTTTTSSYLSGINHLSRHYGEDIFQISDYETVEQIRSQYDLQGTHRKVGEYGNGAARASIRQYSFFIKLLSDNNLELNETHTSSLAKHATADDTTDMNMSFTYERDLHNSLICQATELFPEHNLKGTEYTIGNGRIDLLLENEDELLVIELKSGTASADVFGQISMYLGLLKQEFPEKNIRGVVIASEIHKGLKYACDTNPLITCMTYAMNISLTAI